MCTAPKVIAAPAVAPAPTKEQIAARAAADAGSLVSQQRALIARRQGVFGNIRTSALGDASYGTMSVARFG